MKPAQIILSRCIDYAGMFPPAELDLETAVRNYANYLGSRDAWALGMFVLPFQRLGEFTERWPEYAQSWRVSAVLRGDISQSQMAFLREGLPYCVDTLECGPLPSRRLNDLQGAVLHRPLFVEVEMSAISEETIKAIAGISARAKIRTGGTIQEAIPSADSVARFISICLLHRVKFKATAGLHHAIRGEYALTHEANSERARMHGFLNVLLASTLLAQGSDVVTATALLEESSFDVFGFSPTGIRWRDRSFSQQQLSMLRRNAMSSFGSCSFTDPMNELRTAGLLD